MKTVYGKDIDPDVAIKSNLRGNVHKIFDQAGVITKEAYDFRGNTVTERRQFSVQYRHNLDWTEEVSNDATALEPDPFYTRTVYDARNQMVRMQDAMGYSTDYNMIPSEN